MIFEIRFNSLVWALHLLRLLLRWEHFHRKHDVFLERSLRRLFIQQHNTKTCIFAKFTVYIIYNIIIFYWIQSYFREIHRIHTVLIIFLWCKLRPHDKDDLPPIIFTVREWYPYHTSRLDFRYVLIQHCENGLKMLVAAGVVGKT